MPQPLASTDRCRGWGTAIRFLTTMVSRSVGPGLFIVSEIAKSHGGEVRVDASDADSTTFTVAMPRPH